MGGAEQVCNELVSFPESLSRPNFSLEVLLFREEDVRRRAERPGWRRRGWVTQKRRLVEVVSQQRLETAADVWALIPGDLARTFTTAFDKPRRLCYKSCI
jgi:hypothetical protein